MSNKNGAKWLSRTRRLANYSKCNFKCVYCNSSKNLSLDHLKPRSKGGNDDDRNLVAACVPCNAARGDKPWWNFADSTAQRRITMYRRRSTNRRMKLAKRVLRSMSWSEIVFFTTGNQE